MHRRVLAGVNARRVLGVLGALACVVALGACRVHTVVGIDVRSDGSGLVRVGVGLDADAARRVPNLAADLRLEDLRAAGWRIVGPRREADGRVWVRASKPFASPAEARRVVAEVSGPAGPLRDVTVRRRAGYWRSRTEVRGTVDLSGGIEALGDEDLRRRLGGSSLGAPRDLIEGRLGAPLEEVFTFQVDVRLPGRTASSNAPVVSGGEARWRVPLGEQVRLAAAAEERNVRRIAGVALTGAGAAGLVVWGALSRRRRRPVRTGRRPR